eukprot:snap_masked-scaffold_9-processed-gene-10.13-mRNA-1 protein AED:1.00 eAED:1.00 QI:0/-1/0/0/-1/1/1/0/59
MNTGMVVLSFNLFLKSATICTTVLNAGENSTINKIKALDVEVEPATFETYKQEKRNFKS